MHGSILFRNPPREERPAGIRRAQAVSSLEGVTAGKSLHSTYVMNSITYVMKIITHVMKIITHVMNPVTYVMNFITYVLWSHFDPTCHIKGKRKTFSQKAPFLQVLIGISL